MDGRQGRRVVPGWNNVEQGIARVDFPGQPKVPGPAGRGLIHLETLRLVAGRLRFRGRKKKAPGPNPASFLFSAADTAKNNHADILGFAVLGSDPGKLARKPFGSLDR